MSNDSPYAPTECPVTRSALDELKGLERACLETLFRTTQACVKLIDPDGTLTFVNEPGLRIMEIPDVDEVLGQSWIEFWPESGREMVDEAVENAREGTLTRFQAICPTMAGRKRLWDVTVAPLLDEKGDVRKVLVTSFDLTESLEREDAFHEREAELVRLIHRERQKNKDSGQSAA